MVYGTKRKQRANKGQKGVARTPKTVRERRKMNPCNIRDEALRKAYDPKKTLKQNLESVDVAKLYADATNKPERLDAPRKVKHIYKVNEEEAPICQAMVKKHGDNFDAMFWDIKINIFQWTVAQCRKKVTAFNKGKIRSMRAEILSGHGMDLRKPLFGAAKERNVFGH